MSARPLSDDILQPTRKWWPTGFLAVRVGLLGLRQPQCRPGHVNSDVGGMKLNMIIYDWIKDREP